jgi:hypothetical protein
MYVRMYVYVCSYVLMCICMYVYYTVTFVSGDALRRYRRNMKDACMYILLS